MCVESLHRHPPGRKSASQHPESPPPILVPEQPARGPPRNTAFRAGPSTASANWFQGLHRHLSLRQQAPAVRASSPRSASQSAIASSRSASSIGDRPRFIRARVLPGTKHEPRPPPQAVRRSAFAAPSARVASSRIIQPIFKQRRAPLNGRRWIIQLMRKPCRQFAKRYHLLVVQVARVKHACAIQHHVNQNRRDLHSSRGSARAAQAPSRQLFEHDCRLQRHRGLPGGLTSREVGQHARHIAPHAIPSSSFGPAPAIDKDRQMSAENDPHSASIGLPFSAISCPGLQLT